MKLLAAFNCFLLVILLHAVANAVEYNRHVTLKPGVFNVSWYYNETNTRFYFRIQASTTGWAALGLTSEDGDDMKNLDVALGGVRNGVPYLNDYATESRGQVKPELDGKQDLTLTSGAESDGRTVLEFNRLADTTDTIQDQVLKYGTNITLCFAIAHNDAPSSTSFNIHYDRDCSPMKYNMFPDDYVQPTMNTTVTPTTAGQLVLTYDNQPLTTNTADTPTYSWSSPAPITNHSSPAPSSSCHQHCLHILTSFLVLLVHLLGNIRKE